ncbi:hypothetical protein SHIRM173S_06275 [Streptomyces hirsutus]
MSEDTTQDSAGFETRARIDTTKPHSARFWNYFVGGKDNYKVDREVGEQIKDIFPGLVDVAHTSRQFLGRAVTHRPGRRGYGSSWTSVRDCRPPTTRIRWRSASLRTRGSCTSTTTRSC